jgi:hypothetical protein
MEDSDIASAMGRTQFDLPWTSCMYLTFSREGGAAHKGLDVDVSKVGRGVGMVFMYYLKNRFGSGG